MDSLQPHLAIYVLSMVCLAVAGPTYGLASLITLLIDVVDHFTPLPKLMEVRNKMLDFMENKWALRVVFALIIVLTPALFLKIHAHGGEDILEVFVRLTIRPFFTH